jgi:hypothetical protein
VLAAIVRHILRLLGISNVLPDRLPQEGVSVVSAYEIQHFPGAPDEHDLVNTWVVFDVELQQVVERVVG